MSDTAPGADELRVRSMLRKLGVGSDTPAPAATPSSPPPNREPEDWWTPATPAAEPEQEQDDEDAEPETDRLPPFAPQPDYWPRPHMPTMIVTAPDRAAAAISPGTRRLLYNASSAGAGWALGLYDQFAAALTDCGTNYSIGGALVLGAGGCLLIAHIWDRRTRHWWGGIAWCARIPLATAVLALALWAPAAS